MSAYSYFLRAMLWLMRSQLAFSEGMNPDSRRALQEDIYRMEGDLLREEINHVR